VLVSAQVALALMLLIAGGLLGRTVLNLRTVPGEHLANRQLHFSLSPGQSGYRAAQLRELVESLATRIAEVPGVVAVSATAATALCVPEGAREQTVPASVIVPGMFAATGTPLLAGRDFTWADREGRPLVAIVNDTFARTYLAGRDVISAPIAFCRNVPPRTIVGVAADRRSAGEREVRPAIYLPFVQPPPAPGGNIVAFTLRTSADPLLMVPDVRRAAADVAPTVPLFDLETGERRRDRTLARERMMTAFVGLYGAAALLMACLGLYGVMTYVVSRRTAEVGLRMALGAQRRVVVAMMLRESVAPVLAGIALGLAGAVALTRWIDALLFGVSGTDPLTIAAAAGLLALTALTAAWLPSRRASRIDPIRALRIG
jgi:predicted permease